MPHSSHSQRVSIVYNPRKERAPVEYQRLKRWLKRHRVHCIGSTGVTAAMKKSDFVIALGGDGTVLSVARQVASWGLPVLGVNVGHLGFLAATEVKDMYKTLTRVLAGEGRVETRTMISISGVSRGKKFGPSLGLNDCVVRSGADGRVLWLQATVRHQILASYRGDGVLLSTPTGSTAYNLAASGPIVHPELDVLLLCPICPHSLVQRPLVFPADETVQIEVRRQSPSAVLSIDGETTRTLYPGDHVIIRRAAEQGRLLMDPSSNYYRVLQNKLKWGGN